MLNHRFEDYPVRNNQNGYVIDTEKGVLVDSSAMNKEQFTKYYRTTNNRTRPDLNLRQATMFDARYSLGESLLWAKRRQ